MREIAAAIGWEKAAEANGAGAISYVINVKGQYILRPYIASFTGSGPAYWTLNYDHLAVFGYLAVDGGGDESVDLQSMPVFSGVAAGDTLAIVQEVTASWYAAPFYVGGTLISTDYLGGTATSNISITDPASSIAVYNYAAGGNGWTYDYLHGTHLPDPSLGPGGSAVATTDVTGSSYVDVRSDAVSASSQDSNDATATASTTGVHTSATAAASSTAAGFAGFAKAVARSNGADGDRNGAANWWAPSGAPLAATALSSSGYSSLIVGTSDAEVGAVAMAGPAEVDAFAETGPRHGGMTMPVITGTQGVATIRGAPTTTALASFMPLTGGAGAEFTSASSVLAIGELGGGRSATTTDAYEIVTSSIAFVVEMNNLSTAAKAGELALGFNPLVATGLIDSLDFTLTADSTVVQSVSFRTIADANTYFSNRAVDLGAIATLAANTNPAYPSASLLTLRAQLTVRSVTDPEFDIALAAGTFSSLGASAAPTTTISAPPSFLNPWVGGSVDVIGPGGATVLVYASSLYNPGGALIGSAVPFADHQWGLHPDLPGIGAYNVYAQVTNAAGLTGTSAHVTMIYDPSAPSVAIATPGRWTALGAQTIAGTVDLDHARAGTSVAVIDTEANGTIVTLGTTTVNVDGTWQLAVALPANGDNTLYATATDFGGLQSTSASIDLKLVPGLPYVAITNYQPVTNVPATYIGGYTEPAVFPAASEVDVFDGATAIGVSFTDASGYWYITATLAEGGHAITARVNGQSSTPVTVTVDTIAPTLAITTPSYTSRQNLFVIQGTEDVADAGAPFSLFVDETVYSVTAAADGSWSLPVTLSPGGHAIVAEAFDAAGNWGGSNTITLTYDPSKPATHWNGPAGSAVNWTDPTYWRPGPPGPTDDVIIDTGVVDIGAGTSVTLASLTVTGSSEVHDKGDLTIGGALVYRAGGRPRLPLTDDPGLHLVADGAPVMPARSVRVRDGRCVVFELPSVPASLRLVSRADAPAELGLSRDPRRLGVAVRRLEVAKGWHLALIEASDARLTAGFHDYEPDADIRWTTGEATIPVSFFAGFAGPLTLTVCLAGSTSYLDEAGRKAAA